MIVELLAWMAYFLPLFYISYIWGKVSAATTLTLFETGSVMVLFTIGYFLVFFPMVAKWVS